MRRAGLALAAAALLAARALPAAGAATEEPLWEAGAGLTVLGFPDYRGSSQSRAYVLPFPYFIYRGEFLRQDRNGLRGIFFRNDAVDLNVSAGASLPVDSSRDQAREGMPDLKASVELGPSLDVRLWEAANRRARLELRMPLRGAITVESHPRFIGAQFSPHLNLDIADPLGHEGWNLGLLAGPVFTDRRYDRYYYEVRPEFATAGRPAYTTGGGYGGMQYIVALSKRYPRFWVGGFARYDTLAGSVFEASPLVTSRRYVAGGIGIAWIIGESQERVPVNPLGEPRP
ncbi:MAG TPA: MipA/OmpV family protein [Usitatibacter sp.]|nr:MipA/OmpV family protein [Usitatibacter sp.]